MLLFCTDCLVNTFKEKLGFFFNWNIIVLQRCISFLLYAVAVHRILAAADLSVENEL